MKNIYVDHLFAIISDHKEIEIDDIAIDGITKNKKVEKIQQKKQLMRIAQECAGLPTLDNNSSEQILGYDRTDFGLWGED